MVVAECFCQLNFLFFGMERVFCRGFSFKCTGVLSSYFGVHESSSVYYTFFKLFVPSKDIEIRGKRYQLVQNIELGKGVRRTLQKFCNR